jgi:hypothetical protein
LLVNSIINFFEENNASNDIAAFMPHLASKTKVYQHILIWSSNDVALFLATRSETSLRPKLCGQVFWFMWWIISTWWRFSYFESDSVSSKSIYLLPHHGSETYFIIYYQVLCDGRWSKQDVVILVPRDVINIKVGDIWSSLLMFTFLKEILWKSTKCYTTIFNELKTFKMEHFCLCVQLSSWIMFNKLRWWN